MNDMLFIILLGVLVVWAFVSTYYCIKFARSILKVTESIEVALDMLDERYRSISKILQIPIFYDSAEVRQALDDIDKSRDAILQAAYVLGHVEEINEDGV